METITDVPNDLRSDRRSYALVEDDDSQYEDIKAALLYSSVMIFAAVAVCLFMADKGTITHLPIERVGYKITRWLEYITEGTETLRQAIDRIAVGVNRSMMVPELKTYMDLTNKIDKHQYMKLAEQWEKSQPLF